MSKHGFVAAMLLLLCGAVTAQDMVIFNGGVGANERASAPTTVTKGPWLILNLPSGRYHVRATRDGGNAQGGSIVVDGSNQEFAYMFRSP